MGWLERLHSQGKQVSRVGLIPSYDNFMHWGNRNDEEAGLPQLWKINGEQNLPYLDSIKDRVKSVHSIDKYDNKVLILVGMGQSIKHSIDALRDLPDRYIICCTNSSCEYLLNHGITPHYVILLDGRAGNWTLDLGDKAKGVTAIFGPCAEPNAIKSWPGNIMIVPLGVKDKSLNRRIRNRWGKTLPGGGNALNSGFTIFSLLTNIKIMVFVGNDLSFKSTYYGDGRKSVNDDSAYFFSIDVNGEQVRTLIPLYEYKIWLETIMAQTWPEYHYINCSGGILGVDVDGELLNFCQHMDLSEAIASINDAFEIEAKDLNFKLKYLYDQFYEHDLGNQTRGKGLWSIIMKHHQFFRGLDVGCGRANGVQYARENGKEVFGCDISSSAVKCWKERGVDQYCSVCPADNMPYPDNSFDFVLCSEVMEHIPEEDTMKTLREILRVGSDKFLFTIALVPEKIPVGGLVQSHINLHPAEWWFDRFHEAGFELAGGATNSEMESVSIMAVKTSAIYKDGLNCLFEDGQGRLNIPVIGSVEGVPEGEMTAI